jgi:hypothetical protein
MAILMKIERDVADNTQNIAVNTQNIAVNEHNIAENKQNIPDNKQEIHNINTGHIPPNIKSKLINCYIFFHRFF